MPRITITVTEDALNALSDIKELLESKQSVLEDRLMATVAEVITEQVKPLRVDQVEVVWNVVQRTRNAAAYSVDVNLSEKVEEQDTGYRTTSKIRKHLREQILMTLEGSISLPKGASISAWIQPIPGGTYGDSVTS